MITTTEAIVIISLSVIGSLCVALIGLFYKLKRLRKSENDLKNLQDHVLLFPHGSGLSKRHINRAVHIMPLTGSLYSDASIN